MARDWFSTFDRESLHAVYVTEEFIPVEVMGTLLVLLTLEERDVFKADDEEDDDKDW